MRLPAAPDAATTSAQVDEVRDAVRALAPDATFPRVDVVGPSVSSQFIEGSILAVLLAGAGMFFYLRFRFEPWFAIGAMATLALDLTKTLGFFALTGIEFNLTAIAALLTLIGYSVNDKVVVFDRMRENQRLHPDMPMRELINRSLTSTLTRTLFTSITTFLAILPMGLAGGDAVASFALPLAVRHCGGHQFIHLYRRTDGADPRQPDDAQARRGRGTQGQPAGGGTGVHGGPGPAVIRVAAGHKSGRLCPAAIPRSPR